MAVPRSCSRTWLPSAARSLAGSTPRSWSTASPTWFPPRPSTTSTTSSRSLMALRAWRCWPITSVSMTVPVSSTTRPATASTTTSPASRKASPTSACRSMTTASSTPARSLAPVVPSAVWIPMRPTRISSSSCASAAPWSSRRRSRTAIRTAGAASTRCSSVLLTSGLSRWTRPVCASRLAKRSARTSSGIRPTRPTASVPWSSSVPTGASAVSATGACLSPATPAPTAARRS